MTTYYDPIYGQIQLNDSVMDIVSKCPELKRLRFIGMMNFKSLEMLPLTSISRLEHTIGLAYLIQLLVRNNRHLLPIYHDLLVAGLYHDVNCGSFGHSVEWAIDRHVSYAHEADAEWVKSDETLSCLTNKPIFLEQDGLHRYRFRTKYSLNFERIEQIINGSGYFWINNKGIDLDNIDNVFRMAHYLGLLPDNSLPINLVNSLRTPQNIDNFVIPKTNIYLIEEWYRLRSKVYKHFIYSDEYMGFEYLIFELISEYAGNLESVEDVKNLFHYTDESLLWLFYEMKESNLRLASLSKRLLLQDLPYCYGILRSSSLPIHNPLCDQQVRRKLSSSISKKLGIDFQLLLHMTTDDRKTNRAIEFYTEENGKHILTRIGEDRRYVLLSILGDRDISSNLSKNIMVTAIGILEKEGFNCFDVIDSKSNKFPQQSLF